MPSHATRGRPAAPGPSQRQLRAGERVRHALAELMREEEIADPALSGVSVTVTEARMSPDLRHAQVFVEPLGAGVDGAKLDATAVIDALNRASKFYRGRLGRAIELKFTPDLKFVHDASFDEASRINRLFDDPVVRRDLDKPPESEREPVDAGEG